MAITFDCESCGGKMQAPEDLAGKRAKCPTCLAVVTVPGGTALEPEQPASTGTETRRPCPACGEMIIVQAARCRFCGEVFDPRLRRRRGGGTGGNPQTALTLGICSLLGGCICPLVGLVVAICGIVIGMQSTGDEFESSKARLGVGLSIVGIILSVLNMAAGVALMLNEMNN